MYLLNPYRVHHWRTSELYEALKAYLGSFIQSVEKGGVCRTPDQAMNRGQKLSAREINSNLNRYQNKKKKKKEVLKSMCIVIHGIGTSKFKL